MKLAIQLYTLREESQKNFISVLEYVAKLGFDGVEFAGYYGKSAEQLKAELDRLGLVCCSTHTPWEEVVNNADATIAMHKALGAKYVIVPWYDLKTAEDVKAFTGKLHSVKVKYAENGLVLGYHNHHQEFEKVDDRYLLDLFAEEAGKDTVLELDTFWSTAGGADTPAYMRAHRDQMPLIHLKDGEGHNPSAIGEGVMDIQSVLDTAAEIGVEWAVVENDNPHPDGFSDVARSMENLKTKYRFER